MSVLQTLLAIAPEVGPLILSWLIHICEEREGYKGLLWDFHFEYLLLSVSALHLDGHSPSPLVGILLSFEEEPSLGS